MIHPFTARAHREKTLRMQSQDRNVDATTAARVTPSTAASTPTASSSTRLSPRDTRTPALPSTAEARSQSPGDTTQPLLFAPLSPLFSETRSATSPRAFTPATPPRRSPETDFVLLCDSPIRSQDLLDLVGTHETSNAAAAAAAVPLTQRTATTLPKPTEVERRITRAYQRELERAQQADDFEPAKDDELADVDGGYVTAEDEEDDDDDGVGHGELDTDNDEDDPDPFRVPDTANDTSPLRFLEPIIRSVYTLVEWLHSQWHLARSPCAVVLHVFAYMFLALGRPDLQQQTFVTVKSVRRALHTDIPVQILPVCPRCREVFPSLNAPERCHSCDEELFRTTTRWGKRVRTDTPIVKYPFCPISAQLEGILSQPGVETACDAWRRCQRTAGTYRDVFDGEVVRNLKAHDGTLFWRNEPDCLTSGPDGELRLGVMWGIDWYISSSTSRLHGSNSLRRFSHIVSNTAPSHSSCPTSFSIANLPLAQR